MSVHMKQTQILENPVLTFKALGVSLKLNKLAAVEFTIY